VKSTAQKQSPPETELPKQVKKVLKPKVPIKAASKVNPLTLALKAIDKSTKGAVKRIELSKAPLPCVSTGSIAIDNLIGGNPSADGTGPVCMGFPRGHISEVYGPEASGKTTLALEAIVEIQKQGGTALFLDYEHALHHGYATKLGIRFDDSFAHLQPDDMEQGMETLRIAALAGVDLIVVDSVAAMVPKSDMEKKFTEGDQIGSRARALASLLPKIVKVLHQPSKHNNKRAAVIFINQTRANISTGPGGGGSGDNTSGGKALKFFAYLRLMVTRIGSEYLEVKDSLSREKRRVPFGNKTLVKVIKSKVDAKQGHSCNIFIRYGQGIDDYYTMIESGVAHKVVKKSGAYYEFEGQNIQGREKFRRFLMSDPKSFQRLRAGVLKAIRAQATDVDLEEDDADVDDLLTSAEIGELEETPEEELVESSDG